MNKIPVIAIDGPAGSGTTTVTASLAKELGANTLFSGTLYRMVGALCLSKSVDVSENEQGVLVWAQTLSKWLRFQGDQVFYGAQDVTKILREERVAEVASKVAKIHRVRECLSEFQLEQRREPLLVAEGRDMGDLFSNEFGPVLRIYLDATPEVRAKRRCLQLKLGGIEANPYGHYGEILAAIKNRDKLDKTREISPLRIHPFATVIDTSSLHPVDVHNIILNLYLEMMEAES
jgi:cytidylate kinase